MWAAGFRNGHLYSVAARPLDPRWSSTDKRRLLGVVATGLYLGWSEDRAFEAGEAYVFLQKHKGISWSKNSSVVEDLNAITSPDVDSTSPEGITSSPEELERIEPSEETDQTE